MPSHPALQLTSRSLLLAAAYFLAGKLGLALPSVDAHITLIWLPTGIALAALLRWGPGCWPGVTLGALLVNLTVPSPPALALAIAVGNTLGPLLAAVALRWLRIDGTLDRATHIFIFVSCAALGMLVSAAGGVSSLHLLGGLPAEAMPVAALTWWAGDFVGVMLAAPLLLNLSSDMLAHLRLRRTEFLAWLGVSCLLGWAVFVLNNDASGRSLPLVFLMMPVVVWSAMRFDRVGASLGTLVCTLMAALATGAGLGPFHLEDTQRGLFVMWTFMAMMALVQLMVTALQTQRRAAEERIRTLAYFDPLTQLPNRNLLFDHLRQALLSSARSRRHGALLLLDLDHFKTINDTHGHDAGDRLLRDVARRLLACVRQADTVARLGGDEFVVILENLGDDAQPAALQAGHVAEKIRGALSAPYAIALHHELGTIEYHSSASIGISLFQGADVPIDELLKRADLTLYQAKAAGRDTVRFFDPTIQLAVENRARLKTRLHLALRKMELRLHYQPQLDRRGQVVGCEALLRWPQEAQTPVSPAEFIPLAEETGLILPIGLWVIDQACQQLQAWSADVATRNLSLSINVSAREFREPDFVERIASALQRHAIRPTLLKLELTEGMVIDDVEDAVTKMRQLKSLGLTLSLDDFGTGYSSLSYLQRLPLDQLKIDQSFVRGLSAHAGNAAIVRAIITLGHALGLEVVAEGVESSEDHAWLHGHGCPLFQGYLFGRPEPAQTLTATLERLASCPPDLSGGSA